MTESIDEPNCVNVIGTFQSEDAAHSRFRPIQTVLQPPHQLESKFVDLPFCSVSVELPEVSQERL